jgi:parvulin-like peptidyl-prolyl isomerase
MEPALHVGVRQVGGDDILQQLYNSQMLHKVLREIAIDEILERSELATPQDFVYTPEEFERLYEQVSKITPFQGMNDSQLTAIAVRTLKLQKFKQSGWGHKVSGYFEEHKVVLDRVMFSLILVEDGSLAQELFFRVASREDSFSQLARTYSQGDHAQQGGSVGPMFVRDLSPAMLNIINKLKPGELSDLFQIGNCFGFIRLDEFKAAELDEPMQQFLIDELFEAWIQAEIANDVGLDTQNPRALPQPILERSSTVKSDISELDTILNVNSDITGTASTLPPHYGEKETVLVESSTDELTEVSTTPEVTVVNEPKLEEIEISTSFFFPKLEDVGQKVKGKR